MTNGTVEHDEAIEHLAFAITELREMMTQPLLESRVSASAGPEELAKASHRSRWFRLN